MIIITTIEITNAGKPSYWYSNRIGDKFDVTGPEDYDGEMCYLWGDKYLIPLQDCIVVSREK